MTDPSAHNDPNQNPGASSGGGGGSNPLDSLKAGDGPILAAAGIALATVAVLFGALLQATAISGPDTWKGIIKTIGLGQVVISGFGSIAGANMNALFVGVALLVAVWLVRDPAGRMAKFAPIVRIVALVAAGWLALFTALSLIVDLTFLGDEFLAALGLLVADAGILILLLGTALAAFGEMRATSR